MTAEAHQAADAAWWDYKRVKEMVRDPPARESALTSKLLALLVTGKPAKALREGLKALADDAGESP